MATRKVTTPKPHVPDAVRQAIRIDWRMGQLTQREIAKKYGVGVGTVNRFCLELEQDGGKLVEKILQQKQELASKGPEMERAVLSEVERRSMFQAFFEDSTHRNLALMMQKVERGLADVSEHRVAQAALKEGRETVLGKVADTMVNVTTVQQQSSAAIAAAAAGLSTSVNPELLRSIDASLDDEY